MSLQSSSTVSSNVLVNTACESLPLLKMSMISSSRATVNLSSPTQPFRSSSNNLLPVSNPLSQYSDSPKQKKKNSSHPISENDYSLLVVSMSQSRYSRQIMRRVLLVVMSNKRNQTNTHQNKISTYMFHLCHQYFKYYKQINYMKIYYINHQILLNESNYKKQNHNYFTRIILH